MYVQPKSGRNKPKYTYLQYNQEIICFDAAVYNSQDDS